MREYFTNVPKIEFEGRDSKKYMHLSITIQMRLLAIKL